MPRYFNIDRYGRQKYGLISIYIFVFDININNKVARTSPMNVKKMYVSETFDHILIVLFDGDLMLLRVLILTVSIRRFT